MFGLSISPIISVALVVSKIPFQWGVGGGGEVGIVVGDELRVPQRAGGSVLALLRSIYGYADLTW